MFEKKNVFIMEINYDFVDSGFVIILLYFELKILIELFR